ncbi:aminoglycoside phosphotransferase family protein [Ornithinimicrobium avium]|uniref:Aminoglycoside phosphotransferase family protein n=1 Tax=Ornithinimicrobium avium TaxID=2283195 RepID=A0A345NJ46_9MICO|nr:aminoglycoside phosphotransferase family protein [Ornithinimicrobium avium]AXH95054.1 aminoglycoside phosphotransferase family protein [Ornithinimicrobium avium]
MYGVRLAWGDLPPDLRSWVGDVLGGPVVTAVSQPGGFSPGTADRVVTASGRRAFVKAVSPAQNPGTPALHRREAAVLRTLTGLAEVPQLIDAYDDGDWVALVVEDVEGAHPSIPWTDEELRASLTSLTRLAGRAAPTTWPALEEELVGELGAWARIRQAGPATVGTPLDPWVADRLDELVDLSARTLPRLRGEAISHTDVRADNLLVTPDGSVRVVDWPWASRGAAWADAVMLLVNVRWGGGLDVRPHLGTVLDLGATHEDVLGLVAGLGGFCTEAGGRAPEPGLPTLRQFQREQARACLLLLRDLWDG